MPKIRKPYTTLRVSKSFLDEHGEPVFSPTQQQFKEETDITNIIRKYDKTGLLTHVNNMQAHYGDYTEVNEYQDALNVVQRAQADFMALPSAIRGKFDNDPGAFVEFVTNPANEKALIEMGLAKAPLFFGEPEKPVAPVVDTPVPEA